MSKDRHMRVSQPVALSDQILAWMAYRDGSSVTEIAVHLRRYPRQTRDILFGGTPG